jgi:rhamnogalacturonan endolyase
VILDAYTLEGKRLWRIDLGRNIRAGAHYTQFLVYDLTATARAEVALRTSDGTTDGQGKVLGDADADWREQGRRGPQADRTGAVVKPTGPRWPRVGRMLKGPEYLTVFDGLTGAALASAPYSPPRNPDTDAPSFEQHDGPVGRRLRQPLRPLPGRRRLSGRPANPSIVMARGYYARTTLAAWDFGTAS